MHVDLHLHTTASDGKLTPSELVGEAARKGLKIIAITDHDSTEGLAEAFEEARKFPELKIIPGIELSTDIPKGEIHLLGYYISYWDQALQAKLAEFRDARFNRGKRMVEKLANLGIYIKWERVLELAQGAVGRPHVAQAMVEAGYVSSAQEAFERYIGRNGPAYAERPKMTPPEAVELVRKMGGLPVLAHPSDIENLEGVLDELQKAGLVGMEAYYQGYPPELVAHLAITAEKRGLIPCGGSDYHGLGSLSVVGIGEVDVPIKSAERLMAMAKDVKG